MDYLSSYMGIPVISPQGDKIGRVADFTIPLNVNYPEFTSIIVKKGGDLRRVTLERIASFTKLGLTLKSGWDDLPEFAEQPDEMLCVRDLLDQQIVDVHGRRVIRVNDLQLSRVNKFFRIVGVDMGETGLLRRMGMGRVPGFLSRLLKVDVKDRIIPWKYVQPLSMTDKSGLKLTITNSALSKIHPADLAEILTDLNGDERARLFESLEDEVAAEALQEMDEDLQVSMIRSLPEERASDIIEEMAPDEAADLLGDLPEEKARELLSLMEEEDASEVRELMVHADDTAGGLMTPDFVAIPSNLNAQETIDKLREMAPDAETIYYVYVVDTEKRLVGVISLRDLIVNQPETPVESFMWRTVYSVKADAPPEDVIELMDKYDLLALPVVDDENHLMGIITHDDVIEIMRE
ncbi:MAG: CBS domain-containing protein [Chloroflexi bacterium]|nr:CBS domain-containing protein [Chloroflexota bacterium]